MSDAASTAEARLDTLHTVEAPEGVRLELRTAGPVPRALAYSIDVSIRGFGYLIALVAALLTFGESAAPWLVILVFVSEWFYPVLFEVLSQGQTIGKRAVGLRVVNDDGTPIGWGSSILRNLLLAADVLPGTYLVGLVSMTATRGFRRVGDLAAGTLVVHSTPVSVGLASRTAAAPASATSASRPPRIPLELAEQRAVIAFAERAANLSEARAEELASAAAALLEPGASARSQLNDIAAWLSGRPGESAQ